MNKWWLILIFFSSTALAIDLPRRLTSGRSDFKSHALGDNCYSMDIFSALPCNPAFLARDQKEYWYGHLFFGNNVQYYNDAKEVLDNRADTATFQRLFSQTRSAELEADIDVGKRNNHFAFSLSPTRINYYSLIRDRVLPYISLYAAQEQILRLQYAWELPNDFYFGVQARGLSRKFILSEFFLTEAVAEGGGDRVLNNRYQNIFYLEPGLLWSAPQTALQPQIAFSITQAGLADKKYDDLSSEIEAEMGASIKPELATGILEVGTHVSLHSQTKRWTDLLSAAATYTIGSSQYVGSISENQADLGLFLQVSKFQTGVVYDYRIFENLLGERDQIHTWYFQLGAEI
jgi:hypothetical protein